jgi:hypothetical protein
MDKILERKQEACIPVEQLIMQITSIEGMPLTEGKLHHWIDRDLLHIITQGEVKSPFSL